MIVIYMGCYGVSWNFPVQIWAFKHMLNCDKVLVRAVKQVSGSPSTNSKYLNRMYFVIIIIIMLNVKVPVIYVTKT